MPRCVLLRDVPPPARGGGPVIVPLRHRGFQSGAVVRDVSGCARGRWSMVSQQAKTMSIPISQAATCKMALSSGFSRAPGKGAWTTQPDLVVTLGRSDHHSARRPGWRLAQLRRQAANRGHSTKQCLALQTASSHQGHSVLPVFQVRATRVGDETRPALHVRRALACLLLNRFFHWVQYLWDDASTSMHSHPSLSHRDLTIPRREVIQQAAWIV